MLGAARRSLHTYFGCLHEAVKCAHNLEDIVYSPGTQEVTSCHMKAFERLVLQHLRPLVRRGLDLLQFADQAGICVEEADIHLQSLYTWIGCNAQ